MIYDIHIFRRSFKQQWTIMTPVTGVWRTRPPSTIRCRRRGTGELWLVESWSQYSALIGCQGAAGAGGGVPGAGRGKLWLVEWRSTHLWLAAGSGCARAGQGGERGRERGAGGAEGRRGDRHRRARAAAAGERAAAANHRGEGSRKVSTKFRDTQYSEKAPILPPSSWAFIHIH